MIFKIDLTVNIVANDEAAACFKLIEYFEKLKEYYDLMETMGVTDDGPEWPELPGEGSLELTDVTDRWTVK